MCRGVPKYKCVGAGAESQGVAVVGVLVVGLHGGEVDVSVDRHCQPQRARLPRHRAHAAARHAHAPDVLEYNHQTQSMYTLSSIIVDI